MQAAAEVVQRRGARFLDAPFTGSKIAAEKGELVYYVAGDDGAVHEAAQIPGSEQQGNRGIRRYRRSNSGKACDEHGDGGECAIRRRSARFGHEMRRDAGEI